MLTHMFRLGFLLLPVTVLAQEPTSRPPNFVVILCDDIGAECVGSYGSRSYKTPVLDQMAREGIRFTDAHSQPLCTPTRLEIMTGQSNARNYKAFSILPPGETTFAHLLKTAGYQTAVAGKWQLLGAAHYPKKLRGTGSTPKIAGFDAWCLWQVESLGNRFWQPSYLEGDQKKKASAEQYGPDLYCAFLCDWIEAQKDKPFIAYYPMALVHDPFVPAPPAKPSEKMLTKPYKASKPKHFASMVQHMDSIVGRITDKLKALGLTENTLVLFIGDNGTHRSVRSKLGERTVRGAKGQTLRTGTHVPMIAWWPGKLKAGSTCDDLIHCRDVLPTLCELAGVTLPKDLPIDGRSFAAQLEGKAGDPREVLTCWYHPRPITRPKSRPVLYAWDKQWKLYDDGRMFDFVADPLEKAPVTIKDLDAAGTTAHASLRQALASMPRR